MKKNNAHFLFYAKEKPFKCAQDLMKTTIYILYDAKHVMDFSYFYFVSASK